MAMEENLEFPSNQKREELERYRRLLRCMILLLIFWFVMLYFIANRENALVIAGIVIMCLWILYMSICIFGNFFQRFRDRHDHQPLGGEEEEELGLTSNLPDVSKNGDAFTDDDDEGQDDQNTLLGFPFEDTLSRVRACPYPVLPGKAPTNGTYTAVFSSIFMGKAIRNEGKLRMEFFQTRENGWTVEGESLFAAVNGIPIEDGFVNSRGEMHWKTGSTIYRGTLDFSSSSMFDGEFMATETRLLAGNVKPPVGRIVRLELAKASFYSSEMEMTSFSTTSSGERTTTKS